MILCFNLLVIIAEEKMKKENMRSRKKILIVLFGLLIVSYIAVSIWISNDVRKILVVGMQNNSNYAPYMTEDVYKKINPYLRHLTNEIKPYRKNDHMLKPVLSLHIFPFAKAWTSHRYDAPGFGFNEQVQLTLRFKDGRWRAVDAHIEP